MAVNSPLTLGLAIGAVALIQCQSVSAADGPKLPPGMDLQLGTASFTPKGCQLDPTAMGCGRYPIPVIELVNRGEAIHIRSIIINKRSTDLHCNRKVDITLNTGDVWTSDKAQDTALADKAADEEKNFLDGNYNFAEFCGQQLIYVDVITDLGDEEFHG